MTKRRSPLVIIFITIFIDLVGFGIVIPVLPLYAQTMNASPTEIGLLVSVFSAMQFIFSPLLGRLSDRVGRRPVLLLSLLGTSAGFLTMGVAGSLAWLFAGRIIDGVSGGNISTAQAYIADVTSPEERSRGMGLIGAAFGLGFVVGPAMGGLLSHISPGAPFLFAGTLAAANAVALYFLLPESLAPEHRREARRRGSILDVFSEAGSWQLGAVMATYFFATLSFGLMTTIYPLFTAKRFEFDATHNGYVFAFVGLIGAVIQGGLLGRLLRAFGDKLLAVVGTAALAISMFFLPATATVAMLLLVSTGIAIGNSLATPTLNGLASKSVNAAWQGRVLGVLQSSASLARIIGPVLGGWLLQHDVKSQTAHYARTPLWAGAIIMLVAFGLALTVHSSRDSSAREATGVNAPNREKVEG
ncbi:MAG TPA: MFS transporter [Blastocatellia bacterium]|nr:MFS transporter [Blastocatellia bacterium]